MLDDEILELINRVIDGDASADEALRLAERERDSREVRKAVASLTAVSHRLDHAVQEEPPAELKDAILGEIARTRARPSRHEVVPMPRPRRRRALFAAAWAAVAAAVLFLVVFVPRYVSRSGANSEATMAQPMNFDWPVVTTIREGKTSLIVRRDDDLILLEPVVAAARPAVVSVLWPAGDATLVATSGPNDSISQEGKVTFTLRSAEERGGVVVRRKSQKRSTEIRVEVNSREMLRAAVPLP